MIHNSTQKGFATLLVIIILGSIITALVLYITTTGLWSIMGSVNDKNSVQADQIASACAEVAMEAMRENNSFTGSGSQTIGANTCNYTVTSGGGNNRIIQVTGIVGNITRKLLITTSEFNPIVVSSWQNVGDF